MRIWLLAGAIAVVGAAAIFLTIAALLKRSTLRRFLTSVEIGAFTVTCRARDWAAETRLLTDRVRGVAGCRAFVIESVTDAGERTRFRLEYDHVPFRFRRIRSGDIRHPVSRAYWRLIGHVHRLEERSAA